MLFTMSQWRRFKFKRCKLCDGYRHKIILGKCSGIIIREMSNAITDKNAIKLVFVLFVIKEK